MPDVYAICAPSNTLSTQPQLPHKVLASGYEYFTVKACFDAALYSQCSWSHESFKGVFYNNDLGCLFSTATYGTYVIKCTDISKIVDTSLILQAPVSMGSNLFFTMSCHHEGSGTTSFNLTTNIFVQSKYFRSANDDKNKQNLKFLLMCDKDMLIIFNYNQKYNFTDVNQLPKVFMKS